MKRSKLLFCSALLVAPISGLVAADADKAPDSAPCIQLAVTEENPFANLSVENTATQLAMKITAKNKATYLASNPLADANEFKPEVGDTLFARIKEDVEAGVSENKDDAIAPIGATEPSGASRKYPRILPSNT